MPPFIMTQRHTAMKTQADFLLNLGFIKQLTTSFAFQFFFVIFSEVPQDPNFWFLSNKNPGCVTVQTPAVAAAVLILL